MRPNAAAKSKPRLDTRGASRAGVAQLNVRAGEAAHEAA